jgi:hypothetical protein
MRRSNWILLIAVAVVLLAVGAAFLSRWRPFQRPIFLRFDSATSKQAEQSPLFNGSSDEKRGVIDVIRLVVDSDTILDEIPGLEHCILRDNDANIRAEAVGCLGHVATTHKLPCPKVLVEALLDRDEMVVETARNWTMLFEEFEPGCLETLLRCMRSKDETVLNGAVHCLGRAARGDAEAIKALRGATKNKNRNVRHNAQVAKFAATNNLEEFLAYLIVLQELGDDGLGDVERDEERLMHEKAARALSLNVTTMLALDWSRSRPQQLADNLLKLLGSSSPIHRRGAARLMGNLAKETTIEQQKLNGFTADPLQPWLAAEDAEASQVALKLSELGAMERLNAISETDSDDSVRKVASSSVVRLKAALEKSR